MRRTWWIPPYAGKALLYRGVRNRPMARFHWCEPPPNRSCSGYSRFPIPDSLWAESSLWALCPGIDRPRYADVPYGLSKPCSASDKSRPPLPRPRHSLFVVPMCFSPPKPARPATCAAPCVSVNRIFIESIESSEKDKILRSQFLEIISFSRDFQIFEKSCLRWSCVQDASICIYIILFNVYYIISNIINSPIRDIWSIMCINWKSILVEILYIGHAIDLGN